MASKLVIYRGEYLVSDEMIPTQKHQAEEELLNLEKRFAAMIYFQKDLEGRNI